MRKRSMIARLSSLIVIATLLSGCTSFAPFAPRSTAIPTLTLTPTVTLTPTITPSPTPSSTPTPVPPSVPHGLRQENAATQTYENGTWVTKNAAGEITGTWNEQASEWTYDMDNINIHQVVVGHPIFTPEKYATDILARHLPPDDLSTHFIDPKTNKPLGYGTFSEGTRLVNDQWIGEYNLPVTYISVRVRGCYVNEYGNPFILLSYPNGPDSESIVSYYVDLPVQLGVLGISNQDLTGNINDYNKYRQSVPKESICPFLNGEAFGQQVLIQAFHDRPFGAMNDTEEFTRESNKGADEAIAFLNGNQNPPAVKYSRDAFQHVFSGTLIFPQAESGPIFVD